MSVQSDESSAAFDAQSAPRSDQQSPTTSTSNSNSSAAADDPSAPPTADLETLRTQLAETTQKADDYLRLAQRAQADFVNYRRRVDEERAQLARDASVNFLLRLLPILDDFERALANADQAELESNWGKGIQLVERNLRGLLAAEDVQRIAAEGAEFDPREHEAIGSQPTAAVPESYVLHVVRNGYRKGDRVLRPAQVVVSARPSPEAPANASAPAV